LTFINLNIHCLRFYIVKIIYIFKMTFFKNDFYEKLFEIAFLFRDFQNFGIQKKLQQNDEILRMTF